MSSSPCAADTRLTPAGGAAEPAGRVTAEVRTAGAAFAGTADPRASLAAAPAVDAGVPLGLLPVATAGLVAATPAGTRVCGLAAGDAAAPAVGLVLEIRAPATGADNGALAGAFVVVAFAPADGPPAAALEPRFTAGAGPVDTGRGLDLSGLGVGVGEMTADFRSRLSVDSAAGLTDAGLRGAGFRSMGAGTAGASGTGAGAARFASTARAGGAGFGSLGLRSLLVRTGCSAVPAADLCGPPVTAREAGTDPGCAARRRPGATSAEDFAAAVLPAAARFRVSGFCDLAGAGSGTADFRAGAFSSSKNVSAARPRCRTRPFHTAIGNVNCHAKTRLFFPW